MSAIPLQNPHLEKKRKRIIYNPQDCHDYSKEKPILQEILPGHFILANREGYNSSWILLDYGEVVTHVFYKDARDFYDLEHLWADGEEIPFATKEKEEDK